jgi:hypothetical protein
MIRSSLLATAVALLLSVPAAAATVFSTDFSTDTPGLNVVPAGFSVTGLVDIVGPVNGFGIVTPGGNVVDLDGTPGPGEITSLASYFFQPGDRVSLSFLLGGAQRGSASDNVFARLIFGQVTDALDLTVYGTLGNTVYSGVQSFAATFTAGGSIAGSDPFALTGFTFTAVNAGALAFSIGTTSDDFIGPLVADVTLDIAPIPLPAAGGALVLGLGLLAALRRKRA